MNEGTKFEGMKGPIYTLPEELRRQVIGDQDPHTLTQIARVNKTLSHDALGALYGDLDSPWGLIQLLLEPLKRTATPADAYAAPNPRDGFTMDTPIDDDAFHRFCEIAKLVRHLSWVEDANQMCSECCAIASEQIYDQNTPKVDILEQLLSLRASCTTSYGVRAFTPWVSSSLQSLDLAFGPDIDDVSIVSSLLDVRQLCTAVKHFSFTLDSSNYSLRRNGVIDTLIATIMAMPELRKVSLPSDLITQPFVDALAQLQHLDTLAFTLPMSHVVWDTIYTPSLLFATSDSDESEDSGDNMSDIGDELSPSTIRGLPPVSDGRFERIPSIAPSRFYALHNMRTSARSWREAATIVRAMNHNLRHLTIYLPALRSEEERETALEDILAHCPGVEIYVEEV